MEESQIVLDLEASALSESMQSNKLWGKTNEAKNFTIFRTPHNISQNKKKLFEPSVISIGPFHRGQKHLRAMEEQKWRFLDDFLSRGNHLSLDLLISEMKLLEKKTRSCYNETVDLDSNAFVEMMLLDGCFVLELFLKLYEGNFNSFSEFGWNTPFVFFDFLLLENQIPFFIVDKLYEIGLQEEDRNNFINYLIHLLAEAITGNSTESIKLQPLPDEIHHLVHLCYHCLVPNPGIPVVLSYKPFCLTRIFRANRIINGLLHQFRSRVLRGRSPRSTSRSSSAPLPNSTGNLSSMVIRSATVLKQKGVKFTSKSNPRHMLDISFEYGVLKIPKLKITDFTKPIFSNLLAFEHSKHGKENKPFGRFLTFLDKLVNTTNDVTILQECGIIENWLGSEEELAHFINEVTEGNALTEDHYLVELYLEVSRYIESSWHKNRAKLIRDYFSSPWATISVVAAFILLVLTLVQSFLAIFSYVRPPKP